MPKAQDLTGQRFCRLVALQPDGRNSSGALKWLCVCDCGNKVSVAASSLRSGNTKSCGCLHKEVVSNLLSDSLVGKQYGKLVVLREHHRYNNNVYWECRCSCGNITVVRSGALNSGNTKSCGCTIGKPGGKLDVTGKRYGRLMACYKSGVAANGHSLWRCKCDCGNEVDIDLSSLQSGRTSSCGCGHGRPGGFLDITGQVFGYLTVISFSRRTEEGNLWKCSCSCGNVIEVLAGQLRYGSVRSCGCMLSDTLFKRNYKHGMCGSRLYRIWQNMKSRCNNPNSDEDACYYHRGITYCVEWEDFVNFQKWSEQTGYSDRLTLDRINPYKDYEPSNCRWLSWKGQAANKRASYESLLLPIFTQSVDSHLHPLCVDEVKEYIRDWFREFGVEIFVTANDFDILDMDSGDVDMEAAAFATYVVSVVQDYFIRFCSKNISGLYAEFVAKGVKIRPQLEQSDQVPLYSDFCAHFNKLMGEIRL